VQTPPYMPKLSQNPSQRELVPSPYGFPRIVRVAGMGVILTDSLHADEGPPRGRVRRIIEDARGIALDAGQLPPLPIKKFDRRRALVPVIADEPQAQVSAVLSRETHIEHGKILGEEGPAARFQEFGLEFCDLLLEQSARRGIMHNHPLRDPDPNRSPRGR